MLAGLLAVSTADVCHNSPLQKLDKSSASQLPVVTLGKFFSANLEREARTVKLKVSHEAPKRMI